MADSRNGTFDRESGSSINDEPEFVCVGKIHRAHGIEGEVVLKPMTDFPERIRRGKTLFVGEPKRPLTVRTVRQKPPYLLVRFFEIESLEEANDFRNQFVFVPIAELPPLPDGEYYFHQLIGLDAVDERGEAVGVLSEILETGANDVYVLRAGDGSEKLIAAIPENVLRVDLSARTIWVHVPEAYSAE